MPIYRVTFFHHKSHVCKFRAALRNGSKMVVAFSEEEPVVLEGQTFCFIRHFWINAESVTYSGYVVEDADSPNGSEVFHVPFFRVHTTSSLHGTTVKGVLRFRLADQEGLIPALASIYDKVNV